MSFDGLGLHMGNICRLSAAESRSISPENFTGARGKAGMATDGTGASSSAWESGVLRLDLRYKTSSQFCPAQPKKSRK